MSRYDSDDLRRVSPHLRPVSAFHEPDRSRWAVYAASSARPRRRDSLDGGARPRRETRGRASSRPPRTQRASIRRWALIRRIRDGELSARAGRPILAGQYFRIRRDATISIARITLSDSDRRSNWASRYRNFAPGGRRVTAGDGNMVSVGHIGHPRLAPHGAPGNTRTQDRNTGPGGEATHMSARTPEAEPLLTPAEVATMFRVDPKTVTRWAKAGN